MYIDPTGHSSQYCDRYPQACVDEPQPIPTCGYDQISYDNKDCWLVPIGGWHISLYAYATVDDVRTDLYLGGARITINIRNLGEVTVPWRFLFGSEGVLMQGTGILDGSPITAASWQLDPDLGGWQSPNGYIDYYAGSAEFESGYGGPGYELTPYSHGAVGPGHRGGLYYIPRLRRTPGGGFVSGVTGGGRIPNGQLDLFVGTGYADVATAQQQYGLTNPVGPDGNYIVYEVVCPTQKEGAI
jgi:hypothetical protein